MILLVFASHLYLISVNDFGFIIVRIGGVIFFLMTGFLSVKLCKKRTGRQYFNRFVENFPVYWLLLII